MEKNLTQTVELNQFNRFDPNLWFNIVVFFGIILMLTASFLIFRGTKKNSNKIKDGGEDYSDKKTKNNQDSKTTQSRNRSYGIKLIWCYIYFDSKMY